MNLPRTLLLLVWSCISVTLTHGAFEGYQILVITPGTVEHVQFLGKLADDFVYLDFWQQPSPNKTVQAVVPPGLVSIIQERLTNGGVAWKRLDAQLSGMVDAATRKTRVHYSRSADSVGIIDHTNYHTYGEIVTYLRELKVAYPENVDLLYLTHVTHEDREVMAIKLHGRNGGIKPSIIVEAGIHAREWVSPAATLYAIEMILQGYNGSDAGVVSMLDSFDWHFVPVTNPDGYEFTHEAQKNRLWRKNRRRMSYHCVGVDLNRNFDIMHGTTGVSDRCDSNVYPGSHGFSEPETANIRELFNHLKTTVVAYLSVHSYSQLILVPWGYDEGVLRPDNWRELDRVASLMSNAMYAVDREVYQVGTAYQLLGYAASGTSEDWALSQKSDIYAYTYELRPENPGGMGNPSGFLLPPDKIILTGQELLASLKVLAVQMLCKDRK